MDPRGQHQPVRVHQEVAFSSGEALRPVVAPLRTAHPSSFHDLAVDHRGAGVPIAALYLAHLLAQAVVRSPEPSVGSPPAEVVVDGLPRRLLPGQHPPRAAAPKQVEHRAFATRRVGHLDGRPRLLARLRSGLRSAHSSSERSDG